MSLAVVIKGTEGLVLSADSRVTLSAQRQGGPIIPVNFDNATKLLDFPKQPYIGAVTYGAAVIGMRTAHSFLPEFDLQLEEKRLKVEDFGKKLSEFFLEIWRNEVPKEYSGREMTFIVGGYDADEPYGKVFIFGIPNHPNLEPRNPGQNFGMTWGGQLEIISRVIHGYDPKLIDALCKTLNLSGEQVNQLKKVAKEFEFPIPYQVLPLQDCINLATFMIRSTMTFQNLAIGVRGVGGPIEVAVIMRTEPLNYVQQKKIHGEGGFS